MSSSIDACAPVLPLQGRRPYRDTKDLPITLLDLCTTHLEEGLYSQGFSILSNALTAGTTSPTVPALLPPNEHLALAATLAVHPRFTSRTTSPDKHAAADDALRYLRHVNALVGPRNGHLDEALTSLPDGRSSRTKRAEARSFNVANVEHDIGHINSPYTDTASLWTNAQDFWHLVGWAFNCSVRHPTRWSRWKLLLDLLIDILQDDLEIELPAAKEASLTAGLAAVQESPKDLMLTKYLAPVGSGRNNKRRVIRALLADGSPKSLAEFGEVWRNETKPPRPPEGEPWAKRRKLDQENGEFGHHIDDSEEESLNTSIHPSRSATAFPSGREYGAASDGEDESDHDSIRVLTPNVPTTPRGVEAFGGMESLRLRQRILALLATFCSSNPVQLLGTEDLFDLYTEFLRPLPLSIFQQFTLPTKPYLSPLSQLILNRTLLRPLLAATTPPYSETALTQEDFAKHYAPHAANSTSATDNAKVGLLVESMLRFLWTSKTLNVTPKLRKQVRKGITARKERITAVGQRKVGARARVGEEEEAGLVFEASSQRLMMLLDMTL